MRSWRPFCCGFPGSMVSGRIPRRIHQALSGVSRARPMEAKGVPLSERMTAGRPNSRKVLMNTGLCTRAGIG